MPLKYKVQLLIKVGWLDFNRNNGPSMTANPLPNHTEPTIDAITEDSSMRIETKVDEIKSSMDQVYQVMMKMRVILKKKFFEGKCYFCREASTNHII